MLGLSLANNTCDAYSSAVSRPLRSKVSTIRHRHPTTLYLNRASSSNRVLGSGNCKCQDSQGQYNDATESCCDAQKSKYWTFNDIHWPGPNNQVCQYLYSKPLWLKVDLAIVGVVRQWHERDQW
jgi:hypothetical protein